jgi:hypothetical protein
VSETSAEGKGKKNVKTEPTDRERAVVTPTPTDSEFFDWMEQLFFGASSFPEKIEVRPMRGRDYATRGPLLKLYAFGPKDPKPTKEMIVKMSHEISFTVQRDCDIQRKPRRVYGVLAIHFLKDDEPYERYLLERKPTGVYTAKGEGLVPEEDDDDEMTPSRKFSAQVLAHGEAMFDKYTAAFEGLLDRMDRVLERQDTRILNQDARIEKLADNLEKALSLEAEREERRAWTKIKITATEKTLDMGLGMAPGLISGLLGKPELGESFVLKQFFRTVDEGGKMTLEAAERAFGKCDANGVMTAPGVLTEAQGQILMDVAMDRQPPSALDRLLPGGDLQIAMEQVFALDQIFAPDHLAPIKQIVQARMERQMKAQQEKRK